MKPQIRIVSALSDKQISRNAAAIMIRIERAEGKALRIKAAGAPHTGYLLTSKSAWLEVPLTPRQPRPQPVQWSDLAVRQSHKYSSGWASLDRWYSIGAMAVVKAKDTRWNEDGDYGKAIAIVEVDEQAAKLRKENVVRALLDSMDSGGCRCEHDCCGHVRTHASYARPLKGNRFAVVLVSTRNI